MSGRLGVRSDEVGRLSLQISRCRRSLKKAFFSVHGDMADKIAMIKKYREVFGVGLKEAKDAVEAYLAQKAPRQDERDPGAVATVKAIGASKWPVFDLRQAEHGARS